MTAFARAEAAYLTPPEPCPRHDDQPKGDCEECSDPNDWDDDYYRDK